MTQDSCVYASFASLCWYGTAFKEGQSIKKVKYSSRISATHIKECKVFVSPSDSNLRIIHDALLPWKMCEDAVLFDLSLRTGLLALLRQLRPWLTTKRGHVMVGIKMQSTLLRFGFNQDGSNPDILPVFGPANLPVKQYTACCFPYHSWAYTLLQCALLSADATSLLHVRLLEPSTSVPFEIL